MLKYELTELKAHSSKEALTLTNQLATTQDALEQERMINTAELATLRKELSDSYRAGLDGREFEEIGRV